MMTDLEQHQHYMEIALSCAKNAWGRTHPNPMVGCVIVKEQSVISEAWHERDGEAHAEILALDKIKGIPTEHLWLYVTLEPCSSPGRTGACTEAIIRSGIGKVIVGTRDPNPAHAGRGIDVLRNAGIEVVEGVCQDACEDLNLIFNHWIVEKSSFFAGKMATTIDGKVATRSGHAKWITGALARQASMYWRRLFPAMAIGSNTLLADDPSLTARITNQEAWSPLRFVLDRRLRCAEFMSAKVFTDAFAQRTIVVTTEDVDAQQLQILEANDIAVWQLKPTDDIGFLKAFRERCTEEHIPSVLFEGGPRLLSSLFTAKLVNYLFAYRAPKLLGDAQAQACLDGFSFGDINDAIRLESVKHRAFEDGDQLMRGHVLYDGG